MAARRDDLQHGTNAASVHGCACTDCREHQQRRMGQDRELGLTGGSYISKSDRPYAHYPGAVAASARHSAGQRAIDDDRHLT